MNEPSEWSLYKIMTNMIFQFIDLIAKYPWGQNCYDNIDDSSSDPKGVTLKKTRNL